MCWYCTPTLVSPARDCALKRARTGHEEEGQTLVGLVTDTEALKSRVVPGLSSSGRVHCRSGGA